MINNSEPSETQQQQSRKNLENKIRQVAPKAMAKISLKAVKDFVKGLPWTKIIQKSETAEKGSRIFPSRTPKNDRAKNFRFDKGSQVGDKYELILQANMNAEDPGVRSEAAKDSHKIWGKVLVDPKNPDPEKAEEDLLASFREKQS